MHVFALLPFVLATIPGSRSVSPVIHEGSRATVVQTLEGFDRPESCAFSLDGAFLFVGHCGSDLFGPERKKVGFVRGRGAVSRFTVSPEGRVEADAPRLVAGLDGPLGLAVLPRATKKYPAGTLLVAQGLALLCDATGESITDAGELGTAILFVDPGSGERLGALPLGAGSEVAKQLGHAVLMPNSLAFDRDGDLYVTDSARGGDRLVPPLEAFPGLLRVPHDAIDDPSRGGLSFTPLPGIPNGVAYWPASDSLLVVTMGGDAPGGKDLYQLPASERTTTPAPLVAGIGTMDGVTVTPAGTIVVSRFSGDLYAIPREGEPFVVRLEPDTPLVAPADHRLLELADGSCLLAVPEQARTELPAGRQRVRLVRLPEGF